MKNAIKGFLLFCTTVLILTAIFMANSSFAQNNPTRMKIGVYDSRVVVFAWSRSNYFKEQMGKIRQHSDSAMKTNDTLKIKEVSIQAMSYQHLLHQMVFSNGSAASILELVKDKLPEVAKQAGVSIVVSKFELNYQDPSIEIVDLTTQVSQLFNPTENIDNMVGNIKKDQPIPLDKLSIEAEMIEGYCNRFGKK
ncbi:MAG: hypothetical protein WCP85_14020 [Mariniphaga sp.]